MVTKVIDRSLISVTEFEALFVTNRWSPAAAMPTGVLNPNWLPEATPRRLPVLADTSVTDPVPLRTYKCAPSAAMARGSDKPDIVRMRERLVGSISVIVLLAPLATNR